MATQIAEIPVTRLARKPIVIPKGVDVKASGQTYSVKGPKGELTRTFHSDVVLTQEDGQFVVAPRVKTKAANMQTGTVCSLLKSMVMGVAEGFEKKLQTVGVGYRSEVKGKKLILTLGFSHPVEYDIPEGITITTPEKDIISVQGCDKQLVGQVAAEIRAYRKPEPYKGKGVRLVGEYIVRKVAKKK